MASKSRETIFDEMLTYISEPLFQVPVNSFMDEHCLIFDIDLKPCKEHFRIFEAYNRIVDKLLEAFCTDANVSNEDVIKGISKLNKIPDLHEYFYIYFEQVLSANDFKLFYALMAKRNILIQEQVLAMILAATGILPESLTRGTYMIKIEQKKSKIDKNIRGNDDDDDADQGESDKMSENKMMKSRNIGDDDRFEQEVMRDVLRKSKDKSHKENMNELNERGFDSKSIEDVERQVQSLSRERKQLEEKMRKMILNSETADDTSFSPSSSLSSLEAAKQWRDGSGNDDGGLNPTKANLLTSFSKLSPEEIKNRQEFLRQQRDKLLNMKKQAREQQLKVASDDDNNSNNSQKRPVSSRTARLLMRNTTSSGAGGVGGVGGVDQSAATKKEDEKKLALRKAIAEKLRQEVIGKI